MTDWREISGEQNLRMAQQMLDQQAEIAELKKQVAALQEREVCPYDCDNCHDDECPCERLGCAGYREHRE